MNILEQGTYALEFMKTYFQFTDEEKGEREAACLKVQFTHAIQLPKEGEILCGRYEIPCIGFAMQDFGMGYYLDEQQYELVLNHALPDTREELISYMGVWKTRTGREQLIALTPANVLELMPNDRFDSESNVGFWLCRMSSTQLDFDKLLKYGLNGLIAEIRGKADENGDTCAGMLYADMEQAIKTVQSVIHYHQKLISGSDHAEKVKISEALAYIADNRPETFYQAVQLMYLYALVSGTYNYGRMDEYLGDFLVDDLARGILTWDEARDILICLWKLIIQRKTTWNGRVIIGGSGRRNDKNADVCAHLILEVAAEVRDVLPQLSLRFGRNQSQELFDHALKNIGTGCVYPILYNDDVNIPSVQNAFGITRQEAVNYIPYGCGEYILYHRSVGTPSDVINLLKALEITIFDGFDHVSQRQIGLRTGQLTDFRDFDDFYQAYCRQVERYVEVEAIQQRTEYKVAEDHSPFLLASILYNDCIERGKAIFCGGARFLGGTLETYGNINTADSLTALKKLVFENQQIAKQELMDMIRMDFVGFETQRNMLCAAPKYGNDNMEADAMAVKVHNHICTYTKAQAQKVGLDTYLVVVINNSANTAMGSFTLASADGRRAYEPMANANNPSGGNDTNGLTAVLNSLVKLPTDIHAGSVQNIKFSKEMFTSYFEKTKTVLQVYFEKGGSQLMINVLGREDLEQALITPEKYKNLIVRVGGFCARFVELDPKVQQEIMSRTMY